ncbi:unnamed protein product, partial [Laminaria digitata]
WYEAIWLVTRSESAGNVVHFQDFATQYPGKSAISLGRRNGCMLLCRRSQPGHQPASQSV